MPIPIVRRPGIPTSVGDHETRIRALERKRRQCCDALETPFDGSTDVPETNVQDAIDYLATHGGGAVDSVSAADASVVITPTTGAVTVMVGTIEGGSP